VRFFVHWFFDYFRRQRKDLSDSIYRRRAGRR
jgi:hypothetical protein